MKLCRWIGIACQAVVIGALLFLAIARLIAISSGARVFVYQGF